MPENNTILDEFHQLDAAVAAERILPCNGSKAWAEGVAALRPFATPELLFEASDQVWRGLPEADWQQAFDSHPRIGEHKAKAATEASLKWSHGEQAAANPDEITKAELAEGNREYEHTFGRIFIVCATGKSAAEMLAILRSRLANDPVTELHEAAEQQQLITRIRLRKWLGLSL